MEFVEILQKTQSAHNQLAQSFQDFTGIISRLVQISEDQKKKISQLKKEISNQKETILKHQDKGKVKNIWKKVKDMKQEPCSLIEIFCNTVKVTGENNMNYQIKKENRTKKHKTEKKIKKNQKTQPKGEKKGEVLKKRQKLKTKSVKKSQVKTSEFFSINESQGKKAETKQPSVINLTTTDP